MNLVKPTDAGRIQAIENTLKARKLENVKVVEIVGEVCLSADWTPDAARAFCAEFGVSGSKGRDVWIFACLRQPYQPKTRF